MFYCLIQRREGEGEREKERARESERDKRCRLELFTDYYVIFLNLHDVVDVNLSC